MSEQSKTNGLADRTKAYALRAIRLYNSLAATGASGVIRSQLLRSAISVGAHYREAIRARSTAEYISKLRVGLQELEESRYWLELLAASDIVSTQRLAPFTSETDELIAIFMSCVRTARARKRSP